MSERNLSSSSPSMGPRRGPFGGGPMGGFGRPVEKAKDFKGTVRRLTQYLRRESWTLLAVSIMAAASTAFAIYAPKVLGRVTNLIFEGVIGKRLPANMTKEQVVSFLRQQGQTTFADMLSKMNVVPGQGINYDAVLEVLALLIGLYVLSALFMWLQQYIMAGVAQRTVYKLRKEVDAKLARLPLRFYDSRSHGDILSRVTNDIDNIAQTLQQSLTQLITAVATIIGVLIMMFSISPALTLVSLAVIPLAFVFTMLIARYSQVQFSKQWASIGELNGHVEESFTGHMVLKLFNRQRDAEQKFDEYNDKVYQASFRAQFVSGVIMPVMNFLSNLNFVAIAVLGGLRVANGALTLGDVQAFLQYSRQFTQPIVQTSSIMNVLQSTVASAERVFELLDEEEEVEKFATPVLIKPDSIKGHVRFEHVYFRYVPEVPLIEDLNLEALPGHTVAIVGPTGAGKTTLVNLLMRFYEIDAGRITIDGIDIRDIRREDLRRLFGMVLQEPWLFKGTVRDNIAYGKEHATEDEIVRAAQAAHADSFIRKLPQGYDTVIDEDATNISQGQKQLITIARAFLADPKILILDEATSNVDTRTEILIQRAMADLMKDRTSFVIAHRLSTIRNAETIIVMDHGRIVEQGNHEQLMAKRGFYYELYTSQFLGAYAEELA
ncbi:ABC transporter ATP-binding protein [Coprothermobacteraceae bacterium]|nr:ABC transporter ATP-binding protein [Coprothermobacteraceae bacterium]